MKLVNNLFLILAILLLNSCQILKKKNEINLKYVETVKEKIEEIIIAKEQKKEPVKIQKEKTKPDSFNRVFYLIGDPYFIDGVEYVPEENFKYNLNGLATFYDKELHKVKTANNDLNKVTELLGRHKTLPLPSIVKITNLENGLSLVIKINDRHDDNSSIIQVSRKVAQLLRFYKNKIARVNIKILTDPSKQMKIVTESMNQPEFIDTVESAPTESVSISDLEDSTNTTITTIESINNPEQPIELLVEKVSNQELFLKVYGFKSYDQAREIIKNEDIIFNITIQNEVEAYSIILGPLENTDVNKLVSSFIAKGYKKTEIILR